MIVVVLLVSMACSSRPPSLDALPVPIRGTVTGLEGAGLVLQNNQGDNLAIQANGNFQFPRPLTAGTVYEVTVLAQPSTPDQLCSVARSRGVAPVAGVSDVTVTCGPPICTIQSFAATPTTVEAGAASTLSWSSIYCTGWKIEPDVFDVTGTSVSVTPAVTTTYVLSATGPDGGSSRQATVTVKPVIDAFMATPATIPAGGSTSLWWNVRGAASVSIDQGVGRVTGSSVTVSPTATTTYRLTATGGGSGGSVTGSFTVNVAPAGSVVLHDAVVAPGGRVNLRPVEAAGARGSPLVLDWTVPSGSGGAVAPPQGATTVFTAPTTPGTYRVEAASASDPSKRGTCTVTVTTPGTWTTLPALFTPRHVGVAVSLDDKLWVIGGGNYAPDMTGVDLASVEMFDPATLTWTSRAPLQMARANHQAAPAGGKIYVFGGSFAVAGGAGYTDTVEEYDPATDTWRYRSRMPTNRSYGTALTVDGKIYLVGGWDAGAWWYASSVDVYDPATDTWAPAGAGGTAGVPDYTQGADVIDGIAYVVSGYDPSLLAYAPGLPGHSVARTGIPAPRSLDEGVVAAKGRIYAVSGALADLRNTEYDPATDTWAERAPMSALRGSVQAAQLGGLVYVVGGIGPAGPTAAPWIGPSVGVVEVYTPP